MVYPRSFLGGSGKASQGDGYFIAPNPPFGLFYYHISESYQTKAEKRRAKEKEKFLNHWFSRLG